MHKKKYIFGFGEQGTGSTVSWKPRLSNCKISFSLEFEQVFECWVHFKSVYTSGKDAF